MVVWETSVPKYYILFLIILTSCKPNYEKYADIKKELISIYIKDQTNRIDAIALAAFILRAIIKDVP